MHVHFRFISFHAEQYTGADGRVWCRVGAGVILTASPGTRDRLCQRPKLGDSGFRQPAAGPMMELGAGGEASECQAASGGRRQGSQGTLPPSRISAGFLVLRLVLLLPEGSGSFQNPRSL